MTKRLTKQDMRHDAFRDLLSTAYRDVEGGVERHWRLYLAGLVLCLAAFVGGKYLLDRVQARRDEASFRLSRVAEAFDAPVLAKDDPSRESFKRQGGVFYDSEAARAQEVSKRLDEAAKDAGAAAPQVALYRAMASARAGKLDEALAQVAPVTADPVAGPLALMLQARLYEAKRRPEKAEESWKKLAGAKSGLLPEGAAQLLLGEYYDRAGNDAKAKEAYTAAEAAWKGKVGDDDPLAARVKSRLEQLKQAVEKPLVGRARGAWGPDARRGEEGRVDTPWRRAGTKQTALNPSRPKGCRGAGVSAALALLDDALKTSPASRRLALAPAALGNATHKGFSTACQAPA